MPVGEQASASYTVREDDTAASLGSGDLPVLATPRLLAWCEAVTCTAAAADVGVGRTTVGTRVQLEHLAASPVGAVLEVSATLVHVDGRLLRFEVLAARGDDQTVLAHGEVTRVVVDADRFLARARG